MQPCMSSTIHLYLVHCILSICYIHGLQCEHTWHHYAALVDRLAEELAILDCRAWCRIAAQLK